jgi:hypothetical protein
MQEQPLKRALVVFVRCNIDNFQKAVNLFMDLVEINITDAETNICKTLFSAQEVYEFTSVIWNII